MEMVCSFLSFDVVVEVDRCGSAVYLVGQYSQLVVYSLVDWRPVQLLQ